MANSWLFEAAVLGSLLFAVSCLWSIARDVRSIKQMTLGEALKLFREELSELNLPEAAEEQKKDWRDQVM